MNILWEALWLFLPAAISNMTPPIANKIPLINRWSTPIDFGKEYHGRRILGDNKRWRGLVTGIIMGTLVGILIHDLASPDLSWPLYILRCAALSAGALVGDAVKSYFKRRRGTPPGNAWFPFDQIDFIIGGFIFMLPFGLPSLNIILVVLGVFFVGNIVITYFSYLLGLKEKPI